jgi:lysine N6-hydroxylase
MEFNKYLDWVSRSLPNLHFQEKVEDICFEKSHFSMTTSKRKMKAKHIVLGNGLTPYIPPCARNYLGQNVYHCKDHLLHTNSWQGKRVVVVGGGQSGAEIVHHILSNNAQLPSDLTWVTKRNQFLPMDDSAFVNEFFTPGFSDSFFQLSGEKRAHLLQEQVLASDGISLHLLEAIYQKLYVLEFIENRGRFFHLLANKQLTNMNLVNGVNDITLSDMKTSQERVISADIVILCTGYRWEFPSYLSSLSNHIQLDNGQFCVNQDFSILWDGPKENRIYVQNAARHTHGVADPNLSLMAWRSSKIINSIAGTTIYDIDNESTAIDWNCILPNKNAEGINVSCA